jgi:YbbR domain-containing protein
MPIHNVGAKLLALVVALVLWIQVASTVEVEHTVELPLEVVSLPDSLVVRRVALPSQAQVRIRGSKLQLLLQDLLRRELGRVELDASEARSGLVRFELTPDQVNVAATAVAIVAPRDVLFRVHPRTTRRVPVRLAMSGQLAAEYIVAGKPEISPFEVEVSGPAPTVAALVHVNTEPIDLARRRQGFRERVRLFGPDDDLRLRPVEVDIAVSIDRIVERTFAQLPISVLSELDPARVDIEPRQAQVRVTGAKGIVESMGPADVSVVVHVGELAPGVYELPAEVLLPEGTGSTSIEPAVFRVVVAGAPR